MPPKRKRKSIQEEPSSAKPAQKKLSLAERRARSKQHAASIGLLPTSSAKTKKTTPVRRTTPRKPAPLPKHEEEEEEEETSSEEEEEAPVVAPPSKRARRSSPPRKAAATARAAAAAAAAKSPPKKTKAQLQEARMQNRAMLQARIDAGVDLSLPVEAAVPVPAAVPAVMPGSQGRRRRRASNPFNSPVPTISPASSYAKQAQVDTAPRLPGVFDLEDDDDQAVQREPQQQRYASAVAQPTVDSEDEQEAELEQDEPLQPDAEADYMEHVEQEINAADSKPIFSYGKMAMAVVTCFVAWSAKQFMDETSSSNVATTTYENLAAFLAPSSTRVCFVDSNIRDENPDPTVPECQDIPKSAWKPCPERTVCAGGIIQRCFDKHLELRNNECVFTEASEKAISEMVQLLENWTRDRICDSGNHSRLFRADQVMNQIIGMEPGLIRMTYNDLLVAENDPQGERMLIGLPSSHPIALSGSCQVKNILRFVIAFMWYLCRTPLTFFLQLFASGLSIYWDLFKETPLQTVVTTIAMPAVGVWIMLWLRRRQAVKEERKQVEVDRANLLYRVYQTLQADPSKLVAITHLQAALIPKDLPKARRNFLTKKVWPRIVSDLQKDSRVRKGPLMMDGVSQECWKWNTTANIVE